MSAKRESRYTYGDSEVAAGRLALVASIFEPTTRRFLLDACRQPPGLAIDLGCGPGFTTRLLHEATKARRTVGLDRSDAFLARARTDAPEGVTFMVHDAREAPLPVAPVDLLYCRLLLPHLVDPASVVIGWSTQLASGGLLLLDELESVDAGEPAFVNYLDQVARPVVAAQGADLYVGPLLHGMEDPRSTERIMDRTATFTPAPALTARIFAMNLAVLADHGEIEPRPDLAAPLEAIARTGQGGPATWRVRQIGFRSNGGVG
jgi:trans-aconitate 2-methyltransferase